MPAPRPVATVDLDGVVADVRHRLHHLESRPKRWDAFFAAAPDDPLIAEGAAVVERLAQDHEIVYLTGRPERCRRETLQWIAAVGLPEGRLLMRGDDDRRPARLTKVGHLRRLAAQAPVAVVVDDDPEVVRAAGSAGFTTMLADWLPRTETLTDAQEREGRS